MFLIKFPPFFAKKKYKLSNFAPKYEIVDKLSIVFIFNQKELTPIVNNKFSRVENEMSKKNAEKLLTY